MTEERSEREKKADTGSITTRSKHGTIHCITIIGQIEGHNELPDHMKTTKYEHILPQLAAIEETDEIDGLLILLNTAGGDVEAGLAIAELIAGMSKPTVSLVLGGGHSIGVPLAVSAKKCFIAPSASLTIHPVRLNGLVIGVPQTFDYFRKVQERIVGFILRNSKMERTILQKLMMETDELATDVGSIVEAEDTVKLGLCDSVGTLKDALGALHEMISDKMASDNNEDDKKTSE